LSGVPRVVKTGVYKMKKMAVKTTSDFILGTGKMGKMEKIVFLN
jgi:hypothetical protein